MAIKWTKKNVNDKIYKALMTPAVQPGATAQTGLVERLKQKALSMKNAGVNNGNRTI